jgi:hypothetical protein
MSWLIPGHRWVMSHLSAVPRDPSGPVTGLPTLIFASSNR